MINFVDVIKEETRENNPNWPKFLIIIQNINNWRVWIWKKNSLFNLINEERGINKIYLYGKDPYEAKYKFLINKGKSAGLKHFNDFKAFIEYSYDIDDIYKIIEEYNPET